jgi:hypothetical protein
MRSLEMVASADGAAHQLGGVRLDGEAEAGRQAGGAEDARGVVGEAAVVQHPHDALLEVLLAARRVVHGAVDQVEGDGVDGEVAAEQVVLQPSGRDGRQRAGLAVPLLARRGDVDLRVAAGGDLVREELRERPHPPFHALGQGAGQRRAAALQRQVDVARLAAEEDVADRAADQEWMAVLLRGDLFDEINGAPLRVGQIPEKVHRMSVS